jgi:hypothetical protein
MKPVVVREVGDAPQPAGSNAAAAPLLAKATRPG